MKDITKYQGVIPAFYACYDEKGEISTEGVKALTRHLISKGVKGVYVGGSSGECIYQHVDERKKVLEEVMEEMYVDDTVDVLEEMPANVVDRLLMATDEETRKKINALLQYPEDSAGSIMNIEYISLRKEMTVADAILKIRQVGINKETIYTCYVTENLSAPVNAVTTSAAEIKKAAEGDQISGTSAEEIPVGNIVESPLVGTFYAAPAEDAESFVKVGDRVEKGQTLGIVEAMKLMNEIESDYSGTVAEILVNNQEGVEYGQPLFRIV